MTLSIEYCESYVTTSADGFFRILKTQYTFFVSFLQEKILEFVDEHILSDTVRSKLEENNMDKIADVYVLLAFWLNWTSTGSQYNTGIRNFWKFPDF